MKKFDLVVLNNEKPYIKLNIKEKTLGIVLDSNQNTAQVLFFNPKNLGEYLIAEIYQKDLNIQQEEISKEIKQDIEKKLDELIKKAKPFFDVPKFKLYDKVKLIVEDEKYTKFGIHKGEIGVVVDDNAVQNYVEVDFVNFNDSISVDFNDLEIINN